jgi:Cu2+-exporting ATPase
MSKDPVCGMAVDEKRAVKLEKEGKTFFFCSQHCKDRFLAAGAEGSPPTEDHAQHHAHMLSDFKKRFWISMLATIPVLILSPFIQSTFRYSISFIGDMLILLAIATFIYFYGGRPFLLGMVNEFKKRQPGMMTLIAVAISVAYIYSALVVLGLRGKFFFWELVTLIDVMLLGHWIEMRSVMAASGSLRELAKLLPSQAHRVLEDGSIQDVRVSDLKKEDIVLIKPGEKVPVDGGVIDGASDVNEAMLTGESRPVSKKKENLVIGGSVNGSGSLTVKVTKTGADSYLSQIVELVKKASQSKSKAQSFADKAAFCLTIIALGVGSITLVSWLMLGRDLGFALERMVTVMVITCPHALGLAIPLVIAVITSLAAGGGLLIRNRIAFEQAYNVDTVVFDKTGTLTKGEFGVIDIISLGDWSENSLLVKAASVEQNSEHMIAGSIVKKAREKGLGLIKAEEFKAIPGKGVAARLEGKEIHLGNREIFGEVGVEIRNIQKKIEELALGSKTIVFVISEGKIMGIIGLADIIRDESKEAVDALKKSGLEVAMITGDNNETAEFVAKDLGLELWFSQVLPDKKAQKINELRRGGKKVAMVGDGVNDAAALASADVGIAIGAGTDVAIETADVILVESDPRGVVDILSLSRISRKKVVQNLVWATGYNIFAIPLAAGLFYKVGIVLPPAVGAVIMSISTIIVAVNARLISYKKEV